MKHVLFGNGVLKRIIKSFDTIYEVATKQILPHGSCYTFSIIAQVLPHVNEQI